MSPIFDGDEFGDDREYASDHDGWEEEVEARAHRQHRAPTSADEQPCECPDCEGSL